MAQPSLAPKRITAMPPMSADDIKAKLENKTEAEKWAMPIDSRCRSNIDDRPEGSGLIEGTDEGTLYVPMHRIALRDTNGLIPASMLPSYIDDMMFGTLTVASDKATFTETPPTGGTQHKYTSPTQGTGELPPPANVIFCDTTTDLQYRYLESEKTNANKNYGFVEVPGSRAINTGYGLSKTDEQGSAALTIRAKTPKYYIGSGSTTFTIDQNQVGLGTLTSTANNTITVESVASKFTIKNLVVANELDSNENVPYHVDIELGCYPATKTEYITKICVKNSSITFSSGNYDMSSNASENDTDIVALSFDFSTRNANEDFFIQGESGNSIKAKVNRITITELL